MTHAKSRMLEARLQLELIIIKHRDSGERRKGREEREVREGSPVTAKL